MSRKRKKKRARSIWSCLNISDRIPIAVLVVVELDCRAGRDTGKGGCRVAWRRVRLSEREVLRPQNAMAIDLYCAEGARRR